MTDSELDATIQDKISKKIEKYGNRSNVGNIIDGTALTQHQRVNILQNKANHPADGRKRQASMHVVLPNVMDKQVKMTPA